MRYIPIDRYGKYLILRKKEIKKESFFHAIKCEETETNSLQNCLYELFCFQGVSVYDLYKSYKFSYPSSPMGIIEFIAWHFNVKKELINDFFKGKKDDEVCCYVDNVLINGYNEDYLFSEEYIKNDSNLSAFTKLFKESIKDL